MPIVRKTGCSRDPQLLCGDSWPVVDTLMGWGPSHLWLESLLSWECGPSGCGGQERDSELAQGRSAQPIWPGALPTFIEPISHGFSGGAFLFRVIWEIIPIQRSLPSTSYVVVPEIAGGSVQGAQARAELALHRGRRPTSLGVKELVGGCLAGQEH